LRCRPNNTRTAPTDITTFQYLRDNQNAVLYIRSAASLQWVRLDLPSLSRQAGEGSLRFIPMQDLIPVTIPWSVDKTAVAASSPPVEGGAGAGTK